MNGLQGFDRLEFNDNLTFNNEIRAESLVEMNTAVRCARLLRGAVTKNTRCARCVRCARLVWEGVTKIPVAPVK